MSCEFDFIYLSKNLCFINSSRTKAAYEGEGKTTVRILNQEQDLGLMIDSYATVRNSFN